MLRKADDLTADLDGLWARLRADRVAVEAAPAEGRATGQDRADGPRTALQMLVGDLGARRATEAPRSTDTVAHMAPRPAPAAVTASPAVITLGQALASHLSHHPEGEVKKVRADAERVVNGVVAMAGDLPLPFYTRQRHKPTATTSSHGAAPER